MKHPWWHWFFTRWEGTDCVETRLQGTNELLNRTVKQIFSCSFCNKEWVRERITDTSTERPRDTLSKGEKS